MTDIVLLTAFTEYTRDPRGSTATPLAPAPTATAAVTVLVAVSITDTVELTSGMYANGAASAPVASASTSPATTTVESPRLPMRFPAPLRTPLITTSTSPLGKYRCDSKSPPRAGGFPAGVPSLSTASPPLPPAAATAEPERT